MNLFDAMAKAGDTAKPSLSRREWDFSDSTLKPNEAHLCECVAYEAHRSVPAACERVERMRSKLGKGAQSFDELYAALHLAVRDEPYAVPNLFWYHPEFPAHPFTTIPSDERERRWGTAYPPFDEAKYLADWLRPAHGMELTRDGRIALAHRFVEAATEVFPPFQTHQHALLEIDWNYSDKHMLKCFAAWLKSRRPEGTPTVNWKGAGEPRRRDAGDLKALGAWRLVQHFGTWEEAFNYAAEILGKGLFCKDQTEWSDAIGRAENTLLRWARNLAELAQGSNRSD